MGWGGTRRVSFGRQNPYPKRFFFGLLLRFPIVRRADFVVVGVYVFLGGDLDVDAAAPRCPHFSSVRYICQMWGSTELCHSGIGTSISIFPLNGASYYCIWKCGTTSTVQTRPEQYLFFLLEGIPRHYHASPPLAAKHNVSLSYNTGSKSTVLGIYLADCISY